MSPTVPALAGTVALMSVPVTKKNAPGMLIAFYALQFFLATGNLMWSIVTRNVAGQTKKVTVLTMSESAILPQPGACAPSRIAADALLPGSQCSSPTRPDASSALRSSRRPPHRDTSPPGPLTSVPPSFPLLPSEFQLQADLPLVHPASLSQLALYCVFAVSCVLVRIMLMRRNMHKRRAAHLAESASGAAVEGEVIEHKNSFADMTDTSNPVSRPAH